MLTFTQKRRNPKIQGKRERMAQSSGFLQPPLATTKQSAELPLSLLFTNAHPHSHEIFRYIALNGSVNIAAMKSL